MPQAMRAPGPQQPMGLSDIAAEFKRLDEKRRQHGLSLGEGARYNSLFTQLSDALTAGERHRKVDLRQFLRVRSRMELIVRTRAGELKTACQDFGGGGCAVESPALFDLGDDVYLDGAILDGKRYQLHGRAQVAWTRLPTTATGRHGYGLKFSIENEEMRDQIDRLLYRVLDAFLHDDGGDELAL